MDLGGSRPHGDRPDVGRLHRGRPVDPHRGAFPGRSGPYSTAGCSSSRPVRKSSRLECSAGSSDPSASGDYLQPWTRFSSPALLLRASRGNRLPCNGRLTAPSSATSRSMWSIGTTARQCSASESRSGMTAVDPALRCGAHGRRHRAEGLVRLPLSADRGRLRRCSPVRRLARPA